LGSSKPSITILSLGPSQRKAVLTEPVVPRSGRLKTHHPKRTMIRRIALPRTRPIRFIMVYLARVTLNLSAEPLGGGPVR